MVGAWRMLWIRAPFPSRYLDLPLVIYDQPDLRPPLNFFKKLPAPPKRQELEASKEVEILAIASISYILKRTSLALSPTLVSLVPYYWIGAVLCLSL